MTVDKRLDRIDKKLNALATREKKETWVTAYVVYEATGWTKTKLRVMRREGVVKYDPAIKRYLLESIPLLFLKNQQNQSV